MSGIVKMRGQPDNRYPVYDFRPTNLQYRTKLWGLILVLTYNTTCFVIFVGFIFLLHNPNRTSLKKLLLSTEQCRPVGKCLFLAFYSLHALLYTFLHSLSVYYVCFISQEVACMTSKSNMFYLKTIVFYIPMLLVIVPSNDVNNSSQNFVIFGICSLFSLGRIGTHLFVRKNCKCKKCHNIKDVRLIYQAEEMLVDEETKINQTNLMTWFGINLLRNCVLAIKVSSGELIHTFTNASSEIQLKPGNYYIRVIDMKLRTDFPNSQTALENYEPTTTPSDHLLPKIEEPPKIQCTIMMID